MKKQISIIIVCFVFVSSLPCVGANCQDINVMPGVEVYFNGETTDAISIVFNNTHYVPMRMIFEKMGATVFYRSRDNQILSLSRNGDTICHVVGSNTVTVNEKQAALSSPSVLEKSQTYIPLEMVSTVFYPDEITCDNERLNIKKYVSENDYHKVVKGSTPKNAPTYKGD